jgi:hypothetical protein
VMRQLEQAIRVTGEIIVQNNTPKQGLFAHRCCAHKAPGTHYRPRFYECPTVDGQWHNALSHNCFRVGAYTGKAYSIKY